MIMLERSNNNCYIRISEKMFEIRNWEMIFARSKLFSFSQFSLITDNRKTMKILNQRLYTVSAALEFAHTSWSKYLCTCCKLEYAINRLQLQRTPVPVVKDNYHNKTGKMICSCFSTRHSQPTLALFVEYVNAEVLWERGTLFLCLLLYNILCTAGAQSAWQFLQLLIFYTETAGSPLCAIFAPTWEPIPRPTDRHKLPPPKAKQLYFSSYVACCTENCFSCNECKH